MVYKELSGGAVQFSNADGHFEPCLLQRWRALVTSKATFRHTKIATGRIYSRYSHEASERMDLVIKLRRSEKPATKSGTQSASSAKAQSRMNTQRPPARHKRDSYG